MQRNTKYLGLDVHQATTVAAIRGADGRMIARSVLETQARAISEFFGRDQLDKWFGSRHSMLGISAWARRANTGAEHEEMRAPADLVAPRMWLMSWVRAAGALR